MKKMKTRTLKLHRETLRQLSTESLDGIRGQLVETGDWCSVPSCIDGCPTALGCTSETIQQR